MKKQLTLLAGVVLVGGFSAQAQISRNIPVQEAKKVVELHTDSKLPVSNAVSPVKAEGSILWSNDFTWSSKWLSTAVNGTVAANFGWQLGTAPNQITTWAFTSNTGNFTGGGAYAGCENGNPTSTPATQDTDAEWIMTYDSIFDFTSVNNLLFQFQEYGAQFTDKQAVEVSVDGGTTWIEVGNNADLGMLTASGGSAFTNPTNRSYNITYALAQAGAALSNNMKFRFRCYWPAGGTNGGIMYGWFVDNVKIVEGYANDIELSQAFAYTGSEMLNYTKFPASQVAATATTVYSGIIKNLGSGSQNMNLGVTNATYTGNNASPVTIAGFTQDTVDVTTPYVIPATLGSVPFTYTATSANNTLSNTTNDTKTTAFEVTPSIYAVDGYTNSASIVGGFFGWATQTGDPAIGSLFQVFANDVTGAMEIDISNVGASSQATYIGRIVYGQIHRINPTTGDPEYIDQTMDHEIVAGNFGNKIRLYFQNPVTLNAGELYVISAGMYDGSEVPIAFSGYIQEGQTVGFNGTTLTSLAGEEGLVEAPVVRLDFTDYTGLNEITLASDVNVAPNPFADVTTINFNLKANAEVSVVVTDIAGRVVYTTTANQLATGQQSITIDGSSFQAGVYNYTLKVGNEVITKRVVKK